MRCGDHVSSVGPVDTAFHERPALLEVDRGIVPFGVGLAAGFDPLVPDGFVALRLRREGWRSGDQGQQKCGQYRAWSHGWSPCGDHGPRIARTASMGTVAASYDVLSIG